MSYEQKIYGRARIHYNEVMEYLDNIVKTDNRFGLSCSALKAQFDVMLQFALLRVSIADGEFASIERQFIEKITDYGDVLDWINQTFDTSFSWNAVFCMSESDIADILDKVSDTYYKKIVAEATASIEYADALSEFDFLKAIIDKVLAIAVSFAYIDGDGHDEREENALTQEVYLHFARPLHEGRKAVADVLHKSSSNNERASFNANNTLASKYAELKKN